MRRAVLVSIRPKWCQLIASGQKTVEIRKTRPGLETPFKCYVYCTMRGNELINGDLATTVDYVAVNGGKVIGEFMCDKMIPIKVFENGAIQDWNFNSLERSCVPYGEVAAYIGAGKVGAGWHISDFVLYDKPKEVCEFFPPCEKVGQPYCFDCRFGLNGEEQPAMRGLRQFDVPCGKHLKWGPQSWCYVEEHSKGVAE